jgi:hypothetical protein
MSDLTTKEETITTLKNKENEYSKTIEILTKEKEELSAKIHFMNQGMKYMTVLLDYTKLQIRYKITVTVLYN